MYEGMVGRSSQNSITINNNNNVIVQYGKTWFMCFLFIIYLATAIETECTLELESCTRAQYIV